VREKLTIFESAWAAKLRHPTKGKSGYPAIRAWESREQAKTKDLNIQY